MGSSTADRLDDVLRSHARSDRAEKEKAYLKSSLVHYGVPVPDIHRLASTAGRGLDRAELLAVTTTLWDDPVDAPVHDRRFLAADLLARRCDLLGPDDVPLIERLLRQARTWALVDTLAPSVVGPLSERHPEALTPVLDRWSGDDDLWMRRAALLAHLVPLRRGGGDWERFTRYADGLLEDREFFVRKAIGWVLRDTARRRPDMVLAWVEPRADRMSGVTLREAVKPLDPAARERLVRRRPTRR